MMNEMTFNGVPFSNFNTFYDGSQLFEIPAKSVEFYQIPGKNGDLSISNDRYENITLKVNCFIRENFIENFSNLINYLSSQSGYGRLEYSQEPTIFRNAEFVNAVVPETGTYIRYGTFTLEFNCKPQKWLKEGEIDRRVTSTRVITNPTLFASKPLIKVTGTGSMTINGTPMTLQNNTGATYIDCEIEDCYEGTINRNNDLLVPNGFPVLSPGSNSLSVSGCTIDVWCRWWKL